MKRKILFICSGNTCRSPMAEGIMRSKILQHDLTDGFDAASAGLCVVENSGANPLSIAVCAENGIDISSHRTRPLSEEMVVDSALILTMTKAHKSVIMENMPQSNSKIFTLTEYAAKLSANPVEHSQDIADPYGGEHTHYQNTFKMIDAYIDIIIQNLIIKREGL